MRTMTPFCLGLPTTLGKTILGVSSSAKPAFILQHASWNGQPCYAPKSARWCTAKGRNRPAGAIIDHDRPSGLVISPFVVRHDCKLRIMQKTTVNDYERTCQWKLCRWRHTLFVKHSCNYWVIGTLLFFMRSTSQNWLKIYIQRHSFYKKLHRAIPPKAMKHCSLQLDLKD